MTAADLPSGLLMDQIDELAHRLGQNAAILECVITAMPDDTNDGVPARSALWQVLRSVQQITCSLDGVNLRKAIAQAIAEPGEQHPDQASRTGEQS